MSAFLGIFSNVLKRMRLTPRAVLYAGQQWFRTYGLGLLRCHSHLVGVVEERCLIAIAQHDIVLGSPGEVACLGSFGQV
jgi:hypothetical protein